MNPDLSEQVEFDSAIILISHDANAGACIVQLPSKTDIKFDGIGRDSDGGFLRTETGVIMRLKAEPALIDELLTKQDLLIQHLDEEGEFVAEYPIMQIEPENQIGFGA